MAGFAGFPKEALTFFGDLKKNNNKEWFEPRKETFETKVKAPMVALVGEINALLAKIAPDHVADPKKAIYRLYRDTRFSKDKTPYKTHIAANFSHRLLDKHAGAGFYCAVSHQSVDFGGGVYMPGPEQVLALRNLLAERHEEFGRLTGAKGFRMLLGDVKGDRLARSPKGFPANHPADDLLRHKQWYWYVELEPELALTPKLLPELTRRFQALLPAIEFLNGPLLVHQKKEARKAEFAR
jgi:uncharacterized protein (TIGR02453 family)